jgi:hypothetical protein
MIRWTLSGAAKSYNDVPSGARITEVHGRPVVGCCETCGGPVFDGDNCEADSEGCTWHKVCPRIWNREAAK